ncbi:MAG: hypothetical protein AAGJ08_22315 [Cyanobacteria bacterium P01_H01_bin.35]
MILTENLTTDCRTLWVAIAHFKPNSSKAYVLFERRFCEIYG